jgi:hypothetical protein
VSVLARCATAGLAAGLVLTAGAGVWAAGAGRQLLATGLGGAALLLFLLGWLLVLPGGLGPAAAPRRPPRRPPGGGGDADERRAGPGGARARRANAPPSVPGIRRSGGG